ncbi:MAG TPA: protein translocase subunit SecD [Planctomycetota bacterium]|jgi:SecD/SecF fusion protein|nr:protein translocase subunit SecD [Planctomycetota bacterium]
MTEKLGRKLTLTILLALAACACLIVPPVFLHRSPFRLGLDLQGGTRLVYHFDFEDALKKGQITATEHADKATMLQNFCSIIRGRVDPNGIMELSIRPEGIDRIVIELPGAADLAAAKTQGKLAHAIAIDDKTLTLDLTDAETVKAFPQSGGLVTIGTEKIAYLKRATAEISGLQRGADGTQAVAHAAGEAIELLSTDDLQKRIENVGDLQFLVNASPGALQALGTDETKERGKLDTWIKAHPNVSYEEFNRLPAADGGPTSPLRWYPRRLEKQELDTSPPESRLVLLMLPPENWIFSGSDLESVAPDRDSYGYPAVRFEMSSEKKDAFGDFTAKHVGEQMAIVLNGEIVTDPKINTKLPGGGIIEGGGGGFTQKEVNDLVTVLRSGSLRIRPDLLSKDRIGATLGENYVRTGIISTLLALALIVVFMIVFYHRLGIFSVIGLFLNLLYLIGTLAFLKATVTLPGIAGIILTLGMAVDSNILIYERLREELARGLKLAQAAKNAFERATVTIIDAHVTQLIAGLILQNVGTGPIKGFAVTLNIGILSTLFTVIIVTEVLVFFDIHRGHKSYSMMRTFHAPNWRFMDFAKYAIAASLIVIVIGDALFLRLPDRDKLGMDFLGGFRVTVNTQEPKQVDEVAKLVHGIPGTIGQSAAVRQVGDSGSRDTGYRQFLIEYKLSGTEEPGQLGTESSGEKQIRDVLAPILQEEPVQVEVAADKSAVSGKIFFEKSHLDTDVKTVLAKGALTDVTIETQPGRPNVFRFTSKTAKDMEPAAVASAIRTQVEGQKDSSGRPFSLLSPVPESSVVGPTIGGELRDKAIIAVLLSLVGTVLYLRVRFAEYSYGIAVVVSLVHDVLIVFGALAVATMTGAIQAELDLAMIAAFLTVIGYSQNDTIVIFDRVRENRRHSTKPLRDILNDSINQTLARTILTTTTVVIVLAILFAFNVGSRNVLEAFSFAMLVGVISGAYSTVYVASPVLLWLEERSAKKKASGTPGSPRKREAAVT